MSNHNLILMTDSYKLTHWKQYPKGTTKIYSYLESRGGKFPATVFFGLQYYLKKYLTGRITQSNIDQAVEFSKLHFNAANVYDLFNIKGWEYILKEHDGLLPIEIKAVQEGTLVNNNNVLMTIENTDDNCFWLTNYIETLLMKIWAPITVATNSFYSKKLLLKYAAKTASGIEGVNYKLHDFGYRGVSSEESAAVLGAAHLTSFHGTDTLAGINLILDYYKWNDVGLPGYSVPASEHSTATPFGKSGEREYVLNMLEQYPEGVVSMVADSYNVFAFAEMIGTDQEIRNKIINRDGVVVIRPDSGDPVEVVSRLLDILWKHFGGGFTDKHYKLLDDHIRIIQGDGIDLQMMEQILVMMDNSRFASDNIVFGSGGGLLQKFDRDTQKFAIKCSLAVINGKEVNVQKDPVTSAGKKSKQGRLKLHPAGGNFFTFSSAQETDVAFSAYHDALKLVYKNGILYNEQNFNQVRDRVWSEHKFIES